MREGNHFSKELALFQSSLPEQGITLRQILDRFGEQGLLLLSAILTIPFLFPVSIPGTSTPFGLVIALVGLGLMTQKTPAFPDKIVDRPICSKKLGAALHRGVSLFERMERIVRPRCAAVTHGRLILRLNGFLLFLCALLLMIPLPLPFSNALPAYGILLLSMGLLEKDGYLVISGYVMTAVATVYISLIGIMGTMGMQKVLDLVS
ncbi:exopolysaccharide biosynthesis protein [Heliobacterium undosum]|uniref:Exopolysaccharide biosynthesis protein n=1 Tax=Heliomicrobium undosum TaxID=121734 RepID=A0A845L3Q2_9FIRM|nr:exopolysaccharide biosynthesis protein [Heliomicrobium undosum]MZP28388.1 exopolysaccharide biosynthesis protein [Heliomicrobium undosum]